ncbi:restriction endonuclease subunit S [Sporolactobacillus sp. THM19-2]|uniref:restriction endonuclease subunit S n=1 Tax=Sporolactobacillus sp. THM19-2 TaxID=2511171 RepID=UPI00101EB598|nr:restriction endonuclease subunit S [Sporolactobacillus sp. THM19-2]RYL88099.1 restriction endonuclease subunit M [Sporolactobacillus sp. THM19-2]
MIKLSERVELVSGSPQFRLTESFDEQAPLYYFYSQTDLSDDLVGMVSPDNDNKKIRTRDKVNTLRAGDVVFSLTSGTASMVRKVHENYLYTQNYVRLDPENHIDSKYLVYLLNENKTIRKQLMIGLQGSQVLKYTLRQLKELKMPKLPSIEKQKNIGEVYFKQLRLHALRNRVAESEKVILLKRLEEATYDE